MNLRGPFYFLIEIYNLVRCFLCDMIVKRTFIITKQRQFQLIGIGTFSFLNPEIGRLLSDIAERAMNTGCSRIFDSFCTLRLGLLRNRRKSIGTVPVLCFKLDCTAMQSLLSSIERKQSMSESTKGNIS